MKLSLTIDDITAEQIAAVSAALNGVPITMNASQTLAVPMPGATASVPMPPNPNNHDTDDGPANMAAPAADSAGLPWDERIHSSNKALNADGSWRKRRGVDANLVTQIEAELKMRGATQAGMYMPPPSTQGNPSNAMPPGPPQYTPPPQQPQFTQPPPDYMITQPGPQFTPPPVMAPAQPPQPPAPTGKLDFPAFMAHIQPKFSQPGPDGAPMINTNYLLTVAQRLSQHLNRPINSIVDIRDDQNAIDAAIWFIQSDGRW